jgi:DNA-binding transcriptional MerR regulator/GGDEF domain-containing protein
MNRPDLERIRKHLQSKEVQDRVQERMQEARSKATVTISRAAGLFRFSETQLREWERRGLLKVDRPALSSDSKTSTGHRQYSLDELDKLALIRELMDQNYGLNEIPQNIDAIWKQVLSEQQSQVAATEAQDGRHVHEVKHVPLERHLETIDQEEFWRYFTAQTLRLSLLLICEDIPDTLAGFILPLEKKNVSTIVRSPHDLPKVGPALVGWLGRNRAFYTFLDAAPTFEYPSDFRVEYLRAVGAESPGEEAVQNNVLIVVQRRARPLVLSAALIETVGRLVELLYQNKEQWQPCFDYEMHDWLYQVTDFTSSQNLPDEILNSLTNLVVALGGKTTDGKDRWGFCNLFLPQDASLPLQQRNLVVRAHSQGAPMRVSSYLLSGRNPGLTFKAYQSGHIVYRPKITPADPVLAYREFEETTRSAIAIPIAGPEGFAVACLYISSDEEEAFSEADQRVLRVLTRMIEELLSTSQARRQVLGKLTDIITNPGLVDMSFKEFLSEDDFINDVEALLAGIHTQDLTEQEAAEPVSIISIDIDDQSSLAMRHGNRVARNLSSAVGSRILGQLRIISDPELRRLYHLNTDRYCLLLKGVSLEEARTRAESLRQALNGDYRIDARGVVIGKPIPREGLLELSNVTVRLAVQCFLYWKLKDLLQRYSPEFAVAEVRALIMRNIDEQLEIGQRDGGDVIISWNPEVWGFRRWPPSDAG